MIVAAADVATTTNVLSVESISAAAEREICVQRPMRIEDQWYRYLASLEAKIGPKLPRTTENVWKALNSLYGLPLPSAGLSEDGGINMVWDSGDHHMEIEVLSTNLEFFYRNRRTGESRFDTGPPLAIFTVDWARSYKHFD